MLTAFRNGRAARGAPRGSRMPRGSRLLSYAARAVLAAAAFAAALAHAQQPIPPLGARVTDLTATLDAGARTALEQKLAAFEQRKGSQIAVLLVPTTAPETIEQYSLRVAEAWQVGRRKIDDGIVLLVAKDDRRVRIEVGYGLEGAVPDALAKRIISEQIVPRFYEGDYAAGLNAGVDALIGLIDGEPLPAPDGSPGRGEGNGIGALPLILFVAIFVAPLLRRSLGAFGGSLALGAGAGLVAWFLSSVLLLALGIGFMVFVLGLAGVGGPGRWASGGPWLGGGGRGFGGGGGFRGGGGRFGGGGASGGW